jgi:2-oxoisovalerate dehydrogenase E1 component alpha subunit
MSPEALIRAYRWMVVARRIDDTLWVLRRQGKGHFVVSCAGHEAVGAGVGLAANLELDYLAPHYRDLSACLAWGLTARDVMAHYFGRASDPCTGGRQPFAHWGSRRRRILSQEGPQPNIVSHAVGFAYANKVTGSEAVVWNAFGDGGAQKGEVHEAMNFAAIHKLPIVFCVENNLYTQSVPLRLESSVTNISSRAQGYGIPGESIDGMDVLAVQAAAAAAIDRARRGEGPTFIEARTYRYMPNTSNDDDTRYRERSEVEQWRAQDPVLRFRQHLLSTLVLSEADAAKLDSEVAEEVAEATAWAEAEPEAAPEHALQHTWAATPA